MEKIIDQIQREKNKLSEKPVILRRAQTIDSERLREILKNSLDQIYDEQVESNETDEYDDEDDDESNSDVEQNNSD